MERCTPRRLPALSRRMALLAAGLLGMLMVTAAVLPSRPRRPSPPRPGSDLPALDPQLPWTVEADRVYHDPARDEYIAEGNVLLAKMDRTISADQVRYSRRHMMAYAEGHVILTVGNDRLAGSYLEMDLESERGTLDNGTIFIRESNYHISGNRIERVGTDLSAIDRGVVTTCDGDPPTGRSRAATSRSTATAPGPRGTPSCTHATSRSCTLRTSRSRARIARAGFWDRNRLLLAQGLLLQPAVLLGHR